MMVSVKAWISSLAIALGTLAPLAQASEAELVVIIDASTELPWAHVDRGEVVSGLHRDLGEALAERLELPVRFLVLPRRRISEALQQGQADLLCAMLPTWLPGPFDWTRPFIPDTELVLSLRSAPRPARLSALAGQRIGTVAGYIYPELDRVLGKDFVRDDAPNSSANLRKLNLGRMQHATANRLFVDYQRRQGQLGVELHPYLVIASYDTHCALSRRGRVTLAQVDQAIAALQADGGLQRLLDRYR